MVQIGTQKNAYNRGFTLIEAMVSACVFTVGSLALLTMMNYSAKANHNSQKMIEANVLASSVLSSKLQLPNDALVTGHNLKNVTANNEETGNYEAQDGTYAVSWTVTQENTLVPYVTVLVQVRWWDMLIESKNTQGDSVRGGWRTYSLQSGRPL